MTELDGKRILVVEDEALVAAMIQDMLSDLGAIVVGPAGTVAKGFALAASGDIEAAVLDVNLRGERIDPLAEWLRARSVPLVFASGYGETGASATADDIVLEKPFNLIALGQALARVLTRR
jgi:DNA-binding response OmpR family regulator